MDNKIYYDKLSDRIMHLGQGFSLNITAQLYAKDEYSGHGRYFHSEYGYNSNKYNNMPKMYSIKRRISASLSIEGMHDGNKIYIGISVGNIEDIKKGLDRIQEWFEDDKYEDLFVLENGKLHTGLDNVNDISFVVNNSGAVLGFTPIIIEYNGSQYEGVRMFLNNYSIYVEMPLYKLKEFKYYISTMNVFLSAQTMFNFIGNRQEYVNKMEFDGEPISKKSSLKKKRNIGDSIIIEEQTKEIDMTTKAVKGRNIGSNDSINLLD